MAGSVPCCRCGHPVTVNVDPRQRRVCLPCKRANGRERMAQWIARNPEKHRQKSAAAESWRKRDKQKQNAKAAVWRAVRDGKLTKQPCEICGNSKVDAHHTVYSRPLDVRWLCRLHHLELHRAEAA